MAASIASSFFSVAPSLPSAKINDDDVSSSSASASIMSLLPSIMDSIRMAEARSCHPDIYESLKTQKHHHQHKTIQWEVGASGPDEDSTARADTDGDDLAVQTFRNNGATCVAVIASERALPLEKQVKIHHLQRRIGSELERRQDEERILADRIPIHMDRALARYEIGNARGALLSLKQVHKMKAQQALLDDAICYLKSLMVDLEIPSEGMPLAMYAAFENKVKLLLEPREDDAIMDGDLLAELGNLSKERCLTKAC